MTDALIFDHVRTPRGKGRPDGALHEITPIRLASQSLAALRTRNRLDPALVDDVVLGCANPVSEQGADIARLAALDAEYSQSVPGVQLNRFCASGLEAVNIAAAKVASGQASAIVAGGVDSMSRVPMGADGGAWSLDPQVAWKTYFTPQGVAADLLATLDGHSRTDVDGFAVESQRRAARAMREGYFAKSIVPVRDVIDEIVLSQDEYPRPETSLESLATLKPAFVQQGEQGGFNAVALLRYPQVEAIRNVHTAGNSSGIVDGAAAVLIGTRDFGTSAGLKPRARLRAAASIGSEPTIMLTGPAACSELALKRAGMSVRDIDLFEINEAFASVVLRFMRALDLSPEVVNVNGGAIALGHPLGATGAILLGTVLDELERRNLNTALITLCAAAGQATATIIERV